MTQSNPNDTDLTHPRCLGWFGTTCIAMGGSNQTILLMSTLLIGQGDIPGQGSAAIPLLILGVFLGWAAAPGWAELTLMFPNRVGGITATCAEAFRPYSEVLANLTGTLYWWGWVPTCGISALLSATAINEWYLPWFPIPWLATEIVLLFTLVNLRGIKFAAQVAKPIAIISATLALLSGLIPILTGHINWTQATSFHLTLPFKGMFGQITSLMAGLYLIGFAAPAFEQATCHVGETINPNQAVPRAIFASAFMAGIYFILLPIVWLGVLGQELLSGDLGHALGPTFAPLLGTSAKAAAIWFLTFNMFHDTLAPLAGATRTLLQLADDNLLPRILSKRAPSDAPSVSTLLMAVVGIAFLWIGEPLWIIAATNFTYLISICLVSVAVWLLRKDQPERDRPYRAPRGTIVLGLIAAGIWSLSVILGFGQFGLPTTIAAIVFAYSGSALYAWRKMSDRRRLGLAPIAHTLHIKLTGAMLLVLILNGIGYLLAVHNVPKDYTALITILSDIFVAVTILTIAVGLVLPGMIAHSVIQVAEAAKRLATITMVDFSRGMIALGQGNLDAAKIRHLDITPINVHSQDEIGDMASSFNRLQKEILQSSLSFDSACQGLRTARDELLNHQKILNELNESLERKVRERTSELALAQEKLLLKARQVGMSEVATNVLHNVGNVLNSINVSASVIKEKLNQAELIGFTKVSDILDEHKMNLGQYLTQDEKGIHLPDYIKYLSRYWDSEKNGISLELSELIKNIDHIKDIISMQQSLAGISGLQQEINIDQLLQDAINVANINFQQTGIKIQKECQLLEPIFSDKVKLLQILINLISNAKDALIASQNQNKLLTLKVSNGSNDKITIDIIDNGIGIDSEHITKIFSHGFTTKKSGHGFGLHSCALAASEMNGKLRAYSAGLGKGAIFTLELPYKIK